MSASEGAASISPQNPVSQPTEVAFPAGAEVEVIKINSEGYSSWYEAKVLDRLTRHVKYKVQYLHLCEDDGQKPLVEDVHAKNVRPRAPRRLSTHGGGKEDEDPNIKIHDLVEAYHSDGWCHGVVSGLRNPVTGLYTVSFPNSREVFQFKPAEIRPQLAYVDGKWVPVLGDAQQAHEGNPSSSDNNGKKVVNLEEGDTTNLDEVLHQKEDPLGDLLENLKQNPIPGLLSSSSTDNSVVLDDWWLVKTNVEGESKGLTVAGYIAKKESQVPFISALIVNRKDTYTLEAADGVTVKVEGMINKTNTLNNGFSHEICERFTIGFPIFWKQYIGIDDDTLGDSPGSITTKEFEPVHGATDYVPLYKSNIRRSRSG